MKQEFKAGDKVYCPKLSLKMLEVIKNEYDEPDLSVTFNNDYVDFDECGKEVVWNKVEVVFHATPENHEMLCKLYGVEFEAPPKPKTPKEVIQAMLDDGWEYVPLLTPITDDETEEITRLFPVLVSKSMWQNPKITHEIHALLFQNGVPVDPKTGKIIIDYIDGEIVTE